MRPARHPSAAQSAEQIPSHLPVATFVAHVIGQFAPGRPDRLGAARAYDAADALGSELPKVVVATL